MSHPDHKDVVDKLFAAHNTGNLELLEGLFAPGYVNHTAPAGQQSAEGRKQAIAGYVAAFPNLHTTVDQQLSENDYVMVRWTTQVTHSGAPLTTPLGTIPPSGARATVRGIILLRISNDRIAEEWDYQDQLDWLRQLGGLPDDGQTGA